MASNNQHKSFTYIKPFSAYVVLSTLSKNNKTALNVSCSLAKSELLLEKLIYKIKILEKKNKKLKI